MAMFEGFNDKGVTVNTHDLDEITSVDGFVIDAFCAPVVPTNAYSTQSQASFEILGHFPALTDKSVHVGFNAVLFPELFHQQWTDREECHQGQYAESEKLKARSTTNGRCDTRACTTDPQTHQEKARDEDLGYKKQDRRASPPMPLEKVHLFHVDGVNVAACTVGASVRCVGWRNSWMRILSAQAHVYFRPLCWRK